MPTCIPADLVADAKCFECLSKQQLQAVIAQLLCNINFSGGGGGQAQTPWQQNVDAAGFILSGASAVVSDSIQGIGGVFGDDGITCSGPLDTSSINADSLIIDVNSHVMISDNAGNITAGPVSGYTGSFTVLTELPSTFKTLTFDRGILITAV